MLKASKYVLGSGAILLVLLFLWLLTTIFLPYGNGENVSFTINEGESLNVIADSLSDENIIRNRFAFWVYTVISGNARDLQAGEYKFSFPISTYRIAFALSNGRSANDIELLIPEGFTIEQIEKQTEKFFGETKQLSSVSMIDWVDEFPFINTLSPINPNLEGFLFPDTYRFKQKATVEDITRKILANFKEKTEDLREEARMQNKNFYDIVTVASILEKEVPHEDMPIAAGIIYKRLETGVPLQVDASLVYILNRPIKRGDTDSLNSLYNTYKYTGLPPGPISNPGLIALEAALSPELSEYWYYLSRQDNGDTVFSRTLEEHNIARIKYLR